MRAIKIILLLSILLITACCETPILCFHKLKLKRVLKGSPEEFKVFLNSHYIDQRNNHFFGATTARQVSYLKTRLKMNAGTYYKFGSIDGLIVIKNHSVIRIVHNPLIRNSNLSELKDSLTYFVRKYRRCNSPSFQPFIDSLEAKHIPYFSSSFDAAAHPDEHEISYFLEDDDRPFKGDVKHMSFLYYNSGSVWMKGIRLGAETKVGEWTEYYENGQIKIKSFYRDIPPASVPLGNGSIKEGVWIYFNQGGTEVKKEIYRNDSLITTTFN